MTFSTVQTEGLVEMLQEKRHQVPWFIAVVILAFLPPLALAQSMRCGSALITEGTSQAKVAALCGQPAQVVHPPAYDAVAPGVSDVQEEFWIYNFGPNKLMQRIRFRNGRVANVTSVGYGY